MRNKSELKRSHSVQAKKNEKEVQRNTRKKISVNIVYTMRKGMTVIEVM